MNEPTDTFSPPRRRAAWILAGVVVLLATQGGLRVWLAKNAERVSDDGAFFTTIARQWTSDPQGTVRQYPLHPGYPVAMVGANRLLTDGEQPSTREDWECAGVAVALVASLLALLGVTE